MNIRINNSNHTNRLIQLLIIAVDYAVVCVLLYFTFGTISETKDWNEEDRQVIWMISTFAFVVAEYLFPPVIHERVVGANSIFHRCTLFVATQTLLTYLLLRAIHFENRLGWQMVVMSPETL